MHSVLHLCALRVFLITLRAHQSLIYAARTAIMRPKVWQISKNIRFLQKILENSRVIDPKALPKDQVPSGTLCLKIESITLD